MNCTGFDPCPLGLAREFYDRKTARMECAECPGAPPPPLTQFRGTPAKSTDWPGYDAPPTPSMTQSIGATPGGDRKEKR